MPNTDHTAASLTTLLADVRTRHIGGTGMQHDERAGELLRAAGVVRRARRKGEAGIEALTEIVTECAEWPSSLRDQVLDRVDACLRVAVRAA